MAHAAYWCPSRLGSVMILSCDWVYISSSWKKYIIENFAILLGVERNKMRLIAYHMFNLNALNYLCQLSLPMWEKDFLDNWFSSCETMYSMWVNTYNEYTKIWPCNSNIAKQTKSIYHGVYCTIDFKSFSTPCGLFIAQQLTRDTRWKLYDQQTRVLQKGTCLFYVC